MEKYAKKLTVFFLISSMGLLALYAQTSLYRGKNPYTKNYNNGDVIRIKINNDFIIKATGEWNRNFEINMNLRPDTKNLPFLNSSEQNHTTNDKQKMRQNVSQRFRFTLTGTITLQPDGTYRLTAIKSIEVDGTQTRITCTGIIQEKFIKNGSIDADDIANLNLVITSKPKVPRDTTYTMGGGQNAANNTAANGATNNQNRQNQNGATDQKFTPAQIRKYVIQYMQEILGGLQWNTAWAINSILKK